MKKIGYIFLAFVLCGCTQPKQEDTNKNQIYTDGTYDVIAQGYGGDFNVKVTIKDDKIADIVVSEHNETPSLGGVAIEQIITQMKEKNTFDVDTVSGATKTSQALINAVKTAQENARIQTK